MMVSNGRFYHVSVFVKKYNEISYYVSRCDMMDENGVVVGYVNIPNVCPDDRVRELLLDGVETLVSTMELVTDEIPVVIEWRGSAKGNGRIFGRRI
jgi:hypothetical protein